MYNPLHGYEQSWQPKEALQALVKDSRFINIRYAPPEIRRGLSFPSQEKTYLLCESGYL